ncbi:MAG: cytochrome C, partial [Bryobacteraceae bacterium]
MRGKWFLMGFVAFPVLACVAGWVALKTRASGFSARAQPTQFETLLATEARKLAIPAGAMARTNPVSDSPEVLAEARAHWADHCSVCHANDGSGATIMGKQMYPPAPDMREARTQQMTDG